MSQLSKHGEIGDDAISEKEWQIRVELAAAYRLVAIYGWDDMIFTHLSARVPGPQEHFLLNPYGLMFDEITASSLVKVDSNGNRVVDNGFHVNDAGFTIHSAVHMNHPKAMAVMHLHSITGSAVASMECGLLPIGQHALTVYDDVAYHEWEGVALNLDERDRLIKDLGNKHCLMLRNHGTLTVGASIAECFMRMYFLERACAIQVATLSGGKSHPASELAVANMQALSNKPGI